MSGTNARTTCIDRAAMSGHERALGSGAHGATRRGFLKFLLTTAQAAAASFNGLSPAQAATQACTAILRVGNCEEPDTLDPRLAETLGAWRIVHDLFLGLTTLDERGHPVLGAAASHRVLDDGRRHQFILADGSWSDGTLVTAMDFVRGWRRAVDPKVASPSAHLLGVLENGEDILRGEKPPDSIGAGCPDSRTVELRLARPVPYLPFLLAHPVMSPARDADSGSGLKQERHDVTNGPYFTREWRPGSYVRLARNRHFADQSRISIDEVYFYPTEDDNTALQMFRTGKLDLNLRWPISLAHSANPRFRRFLWTGRLLACDWIALKIDRPPLADHRVRRAIGLAIDRRALVSALALGQREAYRLVPPYTPGLSTSEIRLDYASVPFDVRLREARALMSAAGYSSARPLHLTFNAIADSEGRLVASAIQSMWRKIDLEVEIQLSDPSTHYNAIRAGLFDLSYLSWLADIPDPYTFASALFSDAGPYITTGYRSNAYDALVRQALGEWDLGRRSNLLAEAEALALTDAPLIPVLFQTSRAIVGAQVDGFGENLLGVHPVRWLRLDCSKR